MQGHSASKIGFVPKQLGSRVCKLNHYHFSIQLDKWIENHYRDQRIVQNNDGKIILLAILRIIWENGSKFSESRD